MGPASRIVPVPLDPPFPPELVPAPPELEPLEPFEPLEPEPPEPDPELLPFIAPPLPLDAVAPSKGVVSAPLHPASAIAKKTADVRWIMGSRRK
jgi:hypothetical protein